MTPDNERLILERLGLIELKLNGSGDSIYRLIGETQANIENLKRIPIELDELENQIITLEARLTAVEDRVSRQKDNLRLREMLDAVNQLPGGWNTAFWLLTAYVGLIDIAVDLIGLVPALNRILGL